MSDQAPLNKALHPTVYNSARSSPRFRRRVSLVVVLFARGVVVSDTLQMMKEQRKISDGVRPTLLTSALLMLAEPLERNFHVPSFITASVGGIVLLGWFVIYGVAVWRQAAQDKKDLEVKHTNAMAQLFSTKHT